MGRAALAARPGSGLASPQPASRWRALRLGAGARSARATLGAELLTELLDPTCGVHQLLGPGVEGMRLRARVELVEGIVFAVCPFHGLTGLDRGTGHKAKVVRHVDEDDFSVVGMNAFFHGVLFSLVQPAPVAPLFNAWLIWGSCSAVGFGSAQECISAAPFHHVKELAVIFGLANLVEQKLHRLDLIHVVEQLAEDPDLLEELGLDEELFLSGARPIDVDGRVDPLLGKPSLEVDLHVAGALEFLIDDLIHSGAGLNECGGDDGQ